MTKMKNRIISLLLLIVFVLPMGMVANASDWVANPADIKAVAYAKGLGIITEYDGAKTVTVGELANAVNILAGGANMADTYLSRAKYDKNAVLSEAITIYTDIAGYAQIAEIQYGSKSCNNLKAIAKKIGLLDGVSAKYQSALTMDDFVMLSFNVLFPKALDTTYWGNGNVVMREDLGVYMNVVLNMYEIKGVVESVSYSSILGKKGTEDGSVVIDGIGYKCEIAQFEDYIGLGVDALIREKDGERIAVALCSRSKTLTIEAEDIRKDTTKTTVKYFNKSGNVKEAKLEAAPDVLYNYEVLTDGYTAEDLKVKQGRLVLVDNDDDGKYEVVKIEEYKSMMVFSVSLESKTIVDPKGNVISIADMIENKYPVFENGVLISPENIAVERVISYYETKPEGVGKGGEITRIYVADNKQAGKITSIKKDKNIIKLDNEDEYHYTDNIKKQLENQSFGDLITVYLDHFGNIAYYELSKDIYSYGYMLGFTTDNGVFSGPQVKMYTENNKFEIFTTKSTININGTKKSVNYVFDAKNDPYGLYSSGSPKSQLVKYKANKDNQLTILLTAVTDITAENDGSGRPHLSREKGTYRYYSTPNVLADDVRLNETTNVFVIPDDIYNPQFEKLFRFGRYGLLTNDGGYSNTEIYDVDEDYYPGTVVCRVSSLRRDVIDDNTGDVYLITDKGEFVADNGELSVRVDTVNIISGKMDKKEFRFRSKDLDGPIGTIVINSTSPRIQVKDLEVGDILHISTDKNVTAEATNLKVWYTKTVPNTEAAKSAYYKYTSTKNYISDRYTYNIGEVVKIVKRGVVVNNQPVPIFRDAEHSGETEAEFEGRMKTYRDYDRVLSIDNSIPVYILDDEGRNPVVLGSINDLRPNDKVFSITRHALPLVFVIDRRTY